MSKVKALLVTVPLTAIKQWWFDDAMTLAAALAFYTMFSLAPLVVVSLAIAGAIMDESTARDELRRQIQTLIGEQGANLVQETLTHASEERKARGLAAVFGVVTLLIGSTGAFAQLQASLNAIWGVKPDTHSARKTVWLLVRTRLLSFGLVLAIGFLLLVSQIASTVLNSVHSYVNHQLPGVPAVWQTMNLVVSLALISLLFALIFKMLPDVKVKWSDVWVGAIVTAVLFGIGRFLVGYYLGNSAVASTYGAAGSLVVVLIWAWFAGCILYYGAEFVQVYARNFGESIAPASYAVRTDRQRAVPDEEVVAEAADEVPAGRAQAAVQHKAPEQRKPVTAAQRQAKHKRKKR